MDNTFKLSDTRVEKANAISRYRRNQKIATSFRVLELFVFLIIVSRFSTQFINFNIKLSSEYFERICMTVTSSRFVFMIGNGIVIVLFLNPYSKNSRKNPDFYEEYVGNCRNNTNNHMQEKLMLISSSSRCHDRQGKIKRSQSDQNMVRTLHDLEESNRKELRRTMTGKKCKKSTNKLAVMSENPMHNEDEMSSEEFKRTVEAFIARQQRFLREE